MCGERVRGTRRQPQHGALTAYGYFLSSATALHITEQLLLPSMEKPPMFGYLASSTKAIRHCLALRRAGCTCPFGTTRRDQHGQPGASRTLGVPRGTASMSTLSERPARSIHRLILNWPFVLRALVQQCRLPPYKVPYRVRFSWSTSTTQLMHVMLETETSSCSLRLRTTQMTLSIGHRAANCLR